jgi:hypothetical protein
MHKSWFIAGLVTLMVPLYVGAAELPNPEPSATEPFAYADFTWLNGTSREKAPVIDTKYFTGEFSFDGNYIYDFANPIDHTLSGSTNAGRTGEFQVEQFGVGGDFHYENIRGRIFTQFGMYATQTPRNDPSPSRGQWDLADAYRYLSEAYAGYHWDYWHGINLDAGIFMSYIGLCSYYNFENWIYQMSYVSANTPWFFNGLRLQTFPTDKLKVELWLINGWQSYGMINGSPGFGWQILWRPTQYFSFVTNEYFGYDTPLVATRARFHTDTSAQLKYHDDPKSTISKAAFSLTVDLGCESGGGVECLNGNSTTPEQSFAGFMFYNRLWFEHDKYAITLGGGAISNPGRYLVLIPPVQTSNPGTYGGASAITGSSQLGTACANCFSTGPGLPFHAWDASVTFDYMPSQYITYRAEYIHRHADTPYFSGSGGITSPNGWNTTPQGANWIPDLQNSEDRLNFALMVRL